MPTVLDIFEDDAFSTVSLTNVTNFRPFRPMRLEELGLMPDQGIETTDVAIDEVNGTLRLIPSAPRGGVPATRDNDKRAMRKLSLPHFPYRRTVLADEIKFVRASGGNELENVQTIVNRRIDEMIRDHQFTLEWLRMGAVKGTILDADLTTTLYNLYTEFGVTQQTQAMALTTATTNVREKCEQVQVKIEDALGADPYTDVLVLCGQTFWEKLVTHPKVEEWYTGYSEALTRSQSSTRQPFRFGDLMWERYRGNAGSTPFVGTDDAYAIPVGTGLDQTNYAPSTMMIEGEFLGRPFYTSIKRLDHDKGVEIYTESNPLPLFRKPRAIVKLTKV